MTDLLSMAQNPSQYANIPMQVANPLDQAKDALSLRDMIIGNRLKQNQLQVSNAETQDTMATRDAVAKNSSIDPQTGQMNLDFGGTLKDLAAVSPTAAMNFQIGMQQRQAVLAEKKAQVDATVLGNSLSRINMVGSLMQHVNNQQDLDDLNTAVQSNPSLYAGLDPGSLPKTYDEGKKQAAITQAMKVGDTITKNIEQNRLRLEATRLGAERGQQDATATNEVVKGYTDDPLTKEYVSLTNTYNSYKAMSSTKEFSQGLKDRDLLYNFQNVINPARSATGGTIEQDEEARSTLQSMGVDMNKILTGGTLAPSQRQQIAAFIESKYKLTSLQQQGVFNQYQNRLIHMWSNGRNVDIHHALPLYGNVVDHGPDLTQDEQPEQTPTKGAGAGMPDVNIPSMNASDLYKPLGKGGSVPNPPGADKFNNPAQPQAKTVGYDQIVETAAKYKIPVSKVLSDAKAKGYTVEGEQ